MIIRLPLSMMWFTVTGLSAFVVMEQQTAQITPLGDFGYGASIDVSGSFAIVGNRLASTDSGPLEFRKIDLLVRNSTDGRWDRLKQLTAPSGHTYAGWSVAMDGDTAAVGAPDYLNTSASSTGGGWVYVYARNLGGLNNWGLQKAISGVSLAFGRHVSLSGDTLAIGAPGNGTTIGAIKIHRRNTGGAGQWGEAASIPRPPVGALKGNRDHPFGSVFDLHGDTVAIGSNDDFEETNTLVICDRNTGGAEAWGVSQSLPFQSGDSTFARAVALAGNRLAVTGTGGSSGFVQLYQRSAGGFTPQERLTESAATPELGRAIALGDTTLAVQFLTPMRQVGVRVLRWFDGTLPLLLGDRMVGYDFSSRPRYDLAATADAILTGIDGIGASALPNGQGAVRPLERTQGGADGWGAWPAITPEMAGAGGFGKAMAMKGRWLVVGDPDRPAGGTARGAAALFYRKNDEGRTGEAWTLAARLTPDTPQDNARFGAAVAIDALGNIVVGAPDESPGGAVYRFEPVPAEAGRVQEGSPYVQAARLTIGSATGIRLGASVALARGRILAGAPEDDSQGSNAGAVFQFARVVGGWGFTQLPRTDEDGNYINDGFGTALAADETTLAVTALTDETNGSAVLYDSTTTPVAGWIQRQEIQPLETTRGLFGQSVALAGDRLIVGVYPFALFFLGQGDAFAFTRSGGTWTPFQQLRTTGLENGDVHGASVAIGDTFSVVGVPGDDGTANASAESGAAFLYDMKTAPWPFLHELRPAIAGEASGTTVAAEGMRFAVAAPGADLAGGDTGTVRIYRMGSYERWACGYALPPEAAFPRDDADNDGQTNVEEFAMGSNPLVSSSRGQLTWDLRQTDGASPGLHLRASLDKPVYPGGTDGLAYAFEANDHLHFLTSGRVTLQENNATRITGFLTSSTTASLTGFLRLAVTYGEE
jgi:hypothetical protein